MSGGSPEGSLWAKWDLHVHSPASIRHGYGRQEAQAWDDFLTDLERLPPEFKVIGINDYLFLDGYRRVLAARAAGRLANIQCVFPVVELRLNIFGGTDEHLRRVNYHVIFSDQVDPDDIEHQFLNAIAASYVLQPEYEASLQWRASPTRSSLSELGRRIKASVPTVKRGQFQSDLEEGFNNFNVPLDVIHDALDKHPFRDRCITAVGKAEWSAIKWNDQSIAEKKNVINRAKLVFVAASSPDDWRTARDYLADSGVNAHLVDCSDAHYLSTDTSQKDRIGNCFTWIHADPTFSGLQHAITEFKDRVFVGDIPDQERLIEAHPTKYLRRVSIRKDPQSALSETWFATDLPLNPGFVAIIGNKGNGKSALADTLGLLGSSANQAHASFLNEKRFCDPRHNLAADFAASVTWRSGEVTTRQLDEDVAAKETERLKYLPQSLIEEICTELPGPVDSQFERELRQVIFSHVPLADRLGERNLDGLLQRLTGATEERLRLLRGQLAPTDADIATIEDSLAPDHRAKLEDELRNKQAELDAHESLKPDVVVRPVDDPFAKAESVELAGRIAALREERARVAAQVQSARDRAAEQAALATRAQAAIERVRNLELEYEAFVAAVQEDLAALGLSVADIVTFTVTLGSLETAAEAANRLRNAAQMELNPREDGTPAATVQSLDKELGDLAKKLDAPNRAYQEYLEKLEDWERRRSAIVGDSSEQGTVTFLVQQLSALDDLPERLRSERQRRAAKTRQIHEELLSLANQYRRAYAAVVEFVESHPLAKRFGLEFQVALVEEGFKEKFWRMINRAVLGSFSGVDEGETVLDGLLQSVDWNSTSGVMALLSELDRRLHEDTRPGRGQVTQVPPQLRRGAGTAELYDMIWGLEYLIPRYELQSAGRPISRISPGEKGTLLLIFYLLVDQSDVPLVMDQPEENLDNETVFTLLVPAFKEAKRRRQLVVVTHNPNIAVVADADQVICARFADGEISYSSGSIENESIVRRLVDVLEGTRPAFDNRDEKYN